MFTLDPCHSNFLTTLEFLLKLFGGVGGLYLFILGLRRYTKDQTWKRNEFVANEIKAFNSDRMARNAMFMLDWGERYIELYPEKADYKERFIKVDRKILRKALQYHELRVKEDGNIRFTEIEATIRDTFDHFLSYFERYSQFIEAGLVTEKELRPYLNYWIVALSTGIEADVRNAIYHYIHSYRFTGTQKLFEKFGVNILPKTNIKSTEEIL